MPYFQVASEALTTAGALIGADAGELLSAQGAFGGESGACMDTPASGACEAFAAAVDGTVGTTQQAVQALGGALREAAFAYQSADSAAATSLTVRGGG